MLSLERQNFYREQYREIRPKWNPATEVYADLVRHYLQPESRVLDIGCGRGGLVEQLAHPLDQVVGIDPDIVSLQAHRLDLPRVASLGRLPFADASFDVAFASWVLEHWEYPAQELREIARVLRPNGVFLYITPNKRHPLIGLNRVLGAASGMQDHLVEFVYGRAEDDTFPIWYRANSRHNLERLAHASGLHVATLFEVEDPTYLAFTPALFQLNVRLEPLIPQTAKLHLVGALQRGA